jgi:(p)ppGpp synthase/HD superfamily hydrolase
MAQLGERFSQALQYAVELHRGQIRKGSGVPYVAHLLGVTALALEFGADEDEAIAALLHDAIEDQGGAATRAEIRRRFGDRVTAIVDGCTDAEVIPKPPWRERKEAYLEHLKGAPPAVCRVSAADKLHNALAILRDYRAGGEPLWERFRGGKDGTLWYYRELVAVFDVVGPAPLAAELRRTVAEIELLAAAPPVVVP